MSWITGWVEILRKVISNNLLSGYTFSPRYIIFVGIAMSLSRGINLFKKVESIKRPIYGQIVQSTRNSGGLYSYRTTAYPPSKFQTVGANAIGAFMWWWILWHCWTEPDHILGEFPYPNPQKWTDAELGIPPDDAD